MNFIQKIISNFQVKKYHDIMRLGGEYSSQQLRTMSRTDYLKEYKGWVFTCVSTIASRTASLDYHLLSDTGKQIDHEYLSLITYDLIEQIASFIKLNGSCFVWKVTVGSRVVGLNVLRPDIIEPIYDKAWAKVTGYKYFVNGKFFTFKADEVLAFHNFNPLQAYPFVSQGVGDVQAAAISIDTDNASAVWNWKYFENSARPHTAIEVPTNIDKDTLERLESQWNNKFKGVNNSNKAAFLTGGMKIANFGTSQREMDFVEGRRLNRDEIFAIFKVPKAVVGLGEGTGQNMNIRSFEIQLAMNAIEPLSIKIQEVLSIGLFGKIGLFEFVNVVPKDSEEVRKDYEIGIITLNEARASRGFTPVKGGETFRTPTGSVTVTGTPEPKKSVFESVIKSIIAKNVKGTEEYKEEQINARDKRIAKHEKKITEIIRTIADRQEKEVLGKVKKAVKTDIPQLDTGKYGALYYSLLKNTYIEIYDEEGNASMTQVGVDTAFKVGDPEVKLIRDSIALWSKSVDVTTNTLLRDTIVDSIDAGEGVSKISDRIKGVFATLKDSRAEAIARTETISASASASIEGWKQSKVVDGKEWYTAKSERTCPLCNSLDGKTIGLDENYFEKGDSLEAGGEKMKFDYRDINGPALHPNCRCTLIPIVK